MTYSLWSLRTLEDTFNKKLFFINFVWGWHFLKFREFWRYDILKLSSGLDLNQEIRMKHFITKVVVKQKHSAGRVPQINCFEKFYKVHWKSPKFKVYRTATLFNPFYATGLFLYQLKILENQRFSDAFKGYKRRKLWLLLKSIEWCKNLRWSGICTC